jgi:D-alanyl-D-alanine carboxypeptidase
LKKHEARLVAETRKMLDAEATAAAQAEQPKPAPTAPQAATAQKPQAQGAEPQTKRPEASRAQDKRAGGAMATVALRGEQAERVRALAAKHEMSLSKLLVRMMEVFEACQP